MHPYLHAKSSAKKWGGEPEEYLKIHHWFDESKAWVAHQIHRMFRHHSEGIFECEKLFGTHFINSVGTVVYTRYVGEQHVKEDCNGKIPTAKEWVDAITSGEKLPDWILKVKNIED